MGAGEFLTVEVVYALPARQTSATVMLADGGTVLDAVRHSGILARHPEIDIGTAKLGVFGRTAEGSQALREGDRVEIYRPLRIDPKERRRRYREGRDAKDRDGRL